MSDNEAEFLRWLAEEDRERESRRLRERVSQLERLQLASYALMWFWVAVMFCGFRLRPDLVSAEMAGLVTFIALFGGAFVVWHIIRLKRETRRRLEQVQGPVDKEAGQGE